MTDNSMSNLGHLFIGLRQKCDHEIIELTPEQYEEPRRELEPFKCTKCGDMFRRSHLEKVNGKWQMKDYSKFAKGPKRSRRR